MNDEQAYQREIKRLQKLIQADTMQAAQHCRWAIADIQLGRPARGLFHEREAATYSERAKAYQLELNVLLAQRPVTATCTELEAPTTLFTEGKQYVGHRIPNTNAAEFTNDLGNPFILNISAPKVSVFALDRFFCCYAYFNFEG